MAIVYATKTGNWSDTTVWSTGALPTASDDVYANGWTVTINQAVPCLSIRTTAGGSASAGGGFVLANAFNIAGNIISGTTPCLLMNHATGTVTIGGYCLGGSVSGAYGVTKNGNGNCIVNGSPTGGSATTSYSLGFYNNSGSGNITINADCVGGTGAGTQAGGNAGYYEAASGGIVTINGNITAGSNTNCPGLFVAQGTNIFYIVGATTAGAIGNSSHGIGINAGTPTINVTGNVTSGLAGSGVYNGSGATVNITGNVSVPTNGQVGVYNASTGTINIIGNGTAGNTNVAAYNASTGTITISGVATPGTGAYGAQNNSTGTLRVGKAVGSTSTGTAYGGVAGINSSGLTVVKEIEFGTLGQIPVSGFVKFDNSTAIKAQVRRENNTNVTLIDTASGGYPANSDVRYGVTNGSGTGTMRVPLPNQTQAGILVDNTVGTAANLTTADIVAALQTAFPRMPNVATVDSTAQQLIAALSTS